MFFSMAPPEKILFQIAVNIIKLQLPVMFYKVICKFHSWYSKFHVMYKTVKGFLFTC